MRRGVIRVVVIAVIEVESSGGVGVMDWSRGFRRAKQSRVLEMLKDSYLL